MNSNGCDSLELENLRPASRSGSRIPLPVSKTSGAIESAASTTSGALKTVLGDKTNTNSTSMTSYYGNDVSRNASRAHNNGFLHPSAIPSAPSAHSASAARSMIDLAVPSHKKQPVTSAPRAHSAARSAISRVGTNSSLPILANGRRATSEMGIGLSWPNQEDGLKALQEEVYALKLAKQELQAKVDKYTTIESQWALDQQKMLDANADLKYRLESRDEAHRADLASRTNEKLLLERKFEDDIREVHAGYISKLKQLEEQRIHEESLIKEHTRRQADQEYSHLLKEKEDMINNQSDAFNKETERLQQELRSSAQYIDTLKTQVAQLNNALSQIQATASSLESVSASKGSRIDELELLLQDHTQDLHSMKLELEEMRIDRDSMKQKLLKEEALRRKLHNQVQELKGNIRVYCRARPPLSFESSPLVDMSFPDEELEGQMMMIAAPSQESATGVTTTKTHSYQFDKIFGPNVGNRDIFEEISQLVQSALDGYNVCIFAYGQTGSGKTYTMSSVDDGMIPLAVRQIFSTAESLKEMGWTYEIEGQFLEIYNETLQDLLNPPGSKNNGSQSPGGTSNGKLDIRHDPKTQKTTVSGLTTVSLDSIDKVTAVLKKASENRFVASTKANERSSRSHSVFLLKIRGENHNTGKVSESTLNLIDLAGSERLSHSQATGDRMKETQAINKSLSCLGDVIYALGSTKDRSHIPYRNSKLTYLLQYSLSGDSKTLMFVNISPMEAHVNETISSLRFATKVNSTQLKKK